MRGMGGVGGRRGRSEGVRGRRGRGEGVGGTRDIGEGVGRTKGRKKDYIIIHTAKIMCTSP